MDNIQDFHKKMSVSNFNKTWDFIDLGDKRTKDDDLEMINTAHSSLYHWKQRSDVLPINLQRGLWQVARVYSLVGLGESALRHAEKCLEMTIEHNFLDFDKAFAYEAVARAYSVLGDFENKDKYKTLALEACESIEKQGDKDYTLSEINSIK